MDIIYYFNSNYDEWYVNTGCVSTFYDLILTKAFFDKLKKI